MSSLKDKAKKFIRIRFPRSSTPPRADEHTLSSASASEVSTLHPSQASSKSKAVKIAKDVFKTSLVLLNAALAGVPLPFKGAFTATIEIINIAEVLSRI